MARYEVNAVAVARARELIDGRQYVLDSDWGEVQPNAGAGNVYLERHSWEEYAGWHLGLTVGAKDETRRGTPLSTVTSAGSIGPV